MGGDSLRLYVRVASIQHHAFQMVVAETQQISQGGRIHIAHPISSGGARLHRPIGRAVNRPRRGIADKHQTFRPGPMAGKVQDLRFQVEQSAAQIFGSGRQPHVHLKIVPLTRATQRLLNLFHLFIQAQRLGFQGIRRHHQNAHPLSRLRLPLRNPNVQVRHDLRSKSEVNN